MNLQTVQSYAAAIGAAFAVGLWLSIIAWTWVDIRARSRDPVFWIVAPIVCDPDFWYRNLPDSAS